MTTDKAAGAVPQGGDYDWDAAHEALESMDDFARMSVGVAPHGPYTVLRDLLTKAKGWQEAETQLATLTARLGMISNDIRAVAISLKDGPGGARYQWADELDALRLAALTGETK